MTRPEAVILALLSLGGDELPIDTEDIAVRANELVPDVFSWKKSEYADRIDLELVRVALSDAHHKKAWVVGSKAGLGWSLTPKGLERARELASEESPQLQGHGIRGRSERQVEHLRNQLFSSRAWRQHQEGSPMNRDSAYEVFRISIYATREQKQQKVNVMLNRLGDDPEVGQFLQEASKIVLSGEQDV